MCRARGATLLEVMIGATLLGLALGVVLTVIVPGMRLSGRDAARVALGEMGAVALEKICADLQRSSPAGVSLLCLPPEPVVLASEAIEDLTADGTRVWEPQLSVYYWLPAERRLFHRSWPPAPPALTVVFTNLQATTLAAADLRQLAVEGRSLAEQVDSFAVTGTQPLTISLRLSQEVASGGKVEFALERQIYLRN